MFEVLYDTATREILGIGLNADGTFDPGTDPGQGYAIADLADDALMDVILRASSAQLGADGQSVIVDGETFQARPPAQLEASAVAPAAPPTDGDNPPPEAW